MIVEERVFNFYPGKVKEYLALYEDEGLPIQSAHLGRLLGYFVTEIGALNQVVALWGYEDMTEREHLRSRLKADAKWQAYLKKIHPLMLSMENRVYIPTSFSPLK